MYKNRRVRKNNQAFSSPGKLFVFADGSFAVRCFVFSPAFWQHAGLSADQSAQRRNVKVGFFPLRRLPYGG